MYFMEDEKLARMIAFENDHYKFQESPVKNCKNKGNDSDIIDSKLEYIDPTPNIHSLFVNFDKRFFWNSLGMVEVKWSQKMTTCAGICYYHGRNGLCSISLSAPLLSLRPRKDLVETLLHEMIHAYLFVTQNRKDREDHGPEFHKHMHRINKEAGTKISVYHTFHDEVEYYQKHIWRCNGPCQHKKPFFGLVKRASNRAPGPNDFWWNRHKQECGGTFIKISEPTETKKPRKSKKDSKDSKEPAKGKVSPNTKDIRSFFTPVASSSSSDSSSKINGTSNVVTFKDLNNDKKKPNSSISGMTANKGSGTLVITKHKGKEKAETATLEKKDAKSEDQTNLIKSSSCPANCTCKKCKEEATKVKEKLRNVWADKFSSNNASAAPKKVTEVAEEYPSKVKKLNCPICGKGFPENEIEKHVDKCLENMSHNNKTDSNLSSGSSKVSEDKNVEINLIDCPVCNKKIVQKDLKEHLESCLNCSFENEPDDFFNDNDKNEVECKSVPCPCCMKWLPEEKMDAHVDECLTMVALKNGLLDS